MSGTLLYQTNFLDDALIQKLAKNNPKTVFLKQIQHMATKGEFGNLISLIEASFPNFFREYPKILFYLYKMWFLNLKKNKQIKSAEELFEKFIYPLCRKYEVKFDIMKHKEKDFNDRVNIYIIKILDALENTKKDETFDDSNMQIDDFDLNTLHSEIIENIRLSDNESGLSDLEEEFNQIKSKKKIFNIIKYEKITNKNYNINIDKAQQNKVYNPLYELNSNFYMKSNEDKLNEVNHNYFDTFSGNSYTNNSLGNICNNINLNNFTLNKQKNIFEDSYSNYNKYNRNHLPKMAKLNERFKNKNPFLKEFNPKFLKKENIDKKIFRKFRNFVIDKYSNERGLFYNFDTNFWKDFNEQNLLPPMKYNETNTNVMVEFKSFNTKYFLWLFKQKGSLELFYLFIEKEGERVIQSFINEYDLNNSKEEGIIIKLNEYLNKIPKIYSIELTIEPKEIKLEYDYDAMTDKYLGTYELTNEYSNNPFKINFSFTNLNQKLFREENYDKIDFNFRLNDFTNIT